MTFSLRRFLSASIAVVTISMVLSSCQLAKNQLEFDRSAELDRQDVRDAMAPVHLPQEQATDIPDFQSVVSTPEELRLPSPLVTVSVNQTVALRDLLFELAEQADIDLEMDPQIRGSIIFTAKERPFDQVIDRICEMSGLRYKFDNNILRIELDRPYVKTYAVDYINATRKSKSSISTQISMSTAAGDTGASGGGGSSSSVDTETNGDIWKDLKDSLEQILVASDTHVTLATLADPVAIPLNPMPAAPVSGDPNAVQPPPLPGSAQVAPMPGAVAPTLNVSTPPAEPLVPNAPATFSISPQSGVVSVFANERQQRMVQKFLNEFRKRSTTQVLIEAKILQVDLSDEYATGIDWNAINVTGLLLAGGSFPQPAFVPNATGGFTAVLRPGSDLNAAITAVSRFGTVRALSSPRVTVMNGQPAVVNVAKNNVYFDFDVQSEENSDTGDTSLTIDSEQKGVPEGVLLNVVPTANPDTGEIQLVVRPTISKITSFVTDPTITASLAAIGVDPTLFNIPDNQVPEVSVQEIDSTLRIQSGQMMVMGGLMRDENTIEETGVPVLGDMPFVGNLFKSHGDKINKSELVIFIKAQIVSGNAADDTDRKIYNTFGLDRRPGRL